MRLRLILLVLTSIGVHAKDVNNQFVFIENENGAEYFITPESLEPRFSGANVFTRYGGDKQRSLGYMGSSGLLALNAWADIWIENSPINRPFIGNRCMNSASNCPANGYIPAGYMAHDGIYHTMINTSSGEARYARGIFSDSAYAYFKDMHIGGVEIYKYKFCSTKNNYDPARGQTCASVGGEVTTHNFLITKAGHIRLESTNSLQEVLIDSNGKPSVGPGSQSCHIGYLNKDTGIVCKRISYELTGNTLPKMRINMKVDETKVGFSPKPSSIMMSPDGMSNWQNYNATSHIEDLFSSGRHGVYVFFSQTFLRQLINQGVDLTNSKDFFTFLFTNTAVPQSGFYEFSPSNSVTFSPRHYGISIVSRDLDPSPKREGRVGKAQPPIEFDYVVTTSGPRQADMVYAQVIGPTKMLNGQAYCIFSNPAGDLEVPFPASLSWTLANGKTTTEQANCDAYPKMLNTARWVQKPAANPSQSDGYDYSTDLKLTFPMDDPLSRTSLDGRNWSGTVSASGEVLVSATWTGDDIH